MNIENISKELSDQAVKEVKKSGQDWLDYVETHPLQSVFFGLVSFFALRGLLK